LVAGRRLNREGASNRRPGWREVPHVDLHSAR
jgi:hypothetical protein